MSTNIKPPWHFWLLSIASLFWNGMGAMDFYMTQSRNVEYMAQFTPDQLAFFYSFPLWVNITWAIAIGAAVLGSIVLLLRRKLALPIFWIALIAMVATAIHNFGLSKVSMADIAGTPAIIFTLVIFAISCALIWYAGYISKLGYLR